MHSTAPGLDQGATVLFGSRAAAPKNLLKLLKILKIYLSYFSKLVFWPFLTMS